MHTLVHEQLISFYRGFKHDAHPMAIMVGVVGALAAFYPGAADIRYTSALPAGAQLHGCTPWQPQMHAQSPAYHLRPSPCCFPAGLKISTDLGDACMGGPGLAHMGSC